MNSVSSANDEAASSSHGEITPTSNMERAKYPYMDSILYKAAADGKFEPFTQKELSLILTPDKNTILHIHVRSQSEASTATATTAAATFMEQVLDKCPSLLMQVNVLGDTPLHVAAKYGNATAVDFLINQRVLKGFKQMLIRKTNNVGNTSLHEAVINFCVDVVKILTKEDPDFLYPANYLCETPLYIAAEKGYDHIMDEILNNCRKMAYQGPHGKTTLHAAVICKTRDSSRRKNILERMKSLAKEVDEYGWTPLHYAAYYGNKSEVDFLLKCDMWTAYIGDKERKMTPLLLAASQGNFGAMKAIISHCPTCYNLVDIRGWNVLHYLASSGTLFCWRIIFVEYLQLKKFIYRKDADGNTPLHILATLYHKSNTKNMVSLLGLDRSKSYNATNKQGINVRDILSDGFPQLKQEIMRLSKIVDRPYLQGVINFRDTIDDEVTEIERARESYLVVAALIATVTFAATFTMSGGYIQNGSHQGTAILKRNSAFQTFVITNGIAMILSLSAVFIHLIISLMSFRKHIFLFEYALSFTLLAMGAMVIAFMTGAYAMLRPSLWLALITIFIGLTFFFLAIFLYTKTMKAALEIFANSMKLREIDRN